MADIFLDRVARLAGLTVRRLREHQRALRSAGLVDDADDLEKLIREHEVVVFDCGEQTDVGMRKPTSR